MYTGRSKPPFSTALALRYNYHQTSSLNKSNGITEQRQQKTVKQLFGAKNKTSTAKGPNYKRKMSSPILITIIKENLSKVIIPSSVRNPWAAKCKKKARYQQKQYQLCPLSPCFLHLVSLLDHKIQFNDPWLQESMDTQWNLALQLNVT